MNVHLYDLYSVNRGLTRLAKTIDSGQPARTAQADLSRYFLPVVNFLSVAEPYYLIF